MDYIQLLVVHSMQRSVQFYGYDFDGTGVYYFVAFMHSFQKLVSDFGHFQTLL